MRTVTLNSKNDALKELSATTKETKKIQRLHKRAKNSSKKRNYELRLDELFKYKKNLKHLIHRF
jgi:replication-associated recombination protein RarA